MIKHRRISKLAILLGSVLTCALCAGAALPDSGANEKLLIAIRDADAKMAKALLSEGADANAKDSDGLTALMYAAMYASADCVELLLQKGADAKARSKSDITVLMLATGHADKVRLLLSKGAEVNAKSKEGHTALTIAVTRGMSVQVITMLLDNGADLTAGNVLAAAARCGDLKVVKLLLERGANPNNSSNLGGTPARSVKRASEIKKMGRAPGAFVVLLPENASGTPLMYAALARNPEVIKLLLEKGADVNARFAGDGVTLMLAAQMGDPGTTRLLLEKGAEVNVRNEYGYTALMYAAAAESDDPELISALLARGAEINVTAKDGETALKLAARKGKSKIVRMLEQAGARE